MGIMDKVKELFGQATDKLKDPDQNLVEKTWPMGEPDDEHLPQEGQDLEGEQTAGEEFTDSIEGEEQPSSSNQGEPVTGADPELTDPERDNY